MVINPPYGNQTISFSAVYHLKEYVFYPISLKLFGYKPKKVDVILDDKVRVDSHWKEDPSEEVVDNTNSLFQKAHLDRKFYVFHRLHSKEAYGNGSLKPFKTYWSSVGVGDSLDRQIKHPSKIIFGNISFDSFNDWS